MRARWYDPELARFVSEDPIGLAGGINPYVFAGNDPVTRRDPTGLCDEDGKIEEGEVCEISCITVTVERDDDDGMTSGFSDNFGNRGAFPRDLPAGAWYGGGRRGGGGANSAGRSLTGENLGGPTCSEARLLFAATAVFDVLYGVALGTAVVTAGAAVGGVALAAGGAAVGNPGVAVLGAWTTAHYGAIAPGAAVVAASNRLGFGSSFSLAKAEAGYGYGWKWSYLVPGMATGDAYTTMNAACR